MNANFYCMERFNFRAEGKPTNVGFKIRLTEKITDTNVQSPGDGACLCFYSQI